MLDNIELSKLHTEELKEAFFRIDQDAKKLLSYIFPRIKSILTDINDKNDKNFRKRIKSSLSIDLGNILESEKITSSFSLAIEQNFSLIKTLTDKQLNRVKTNVINDIRSGNFKASKLRATLVKDFKMSERHAVLIARDQSHKLTSSLNQIRYEELGVTSYIWRTSRDQRVRGDPVGLYPNAKYSHYKREGEIFYFNSPPPDGNPGTPINCRCYAEPIFKTEPKRKR